MKKIIATDFDGTLCKNGTISKENFDAVKKFRSEGNLFGIATGRDYKALKGSLNNIGFFEYDFLILCNGAVCCNANDEFVVEENVNSKMKWKDSTLALQIRNRLFELGSYCGISFGKERYLFSKDYPDGGNDGTYEYDAHILIEDVSRFSRMYGRGKTAEHAVEINDILADEFGTVVNPTQNSVSIDIPGVDITKSSGIRKYAGLMNVAVENVWTAGNAYNDIPMFDGFHSCLMSDGKEELKNMVDYVYDNVSDYIEFVLKS